MNMQSQVLQLHEAEAIRSIPEVGAESRSGVVSLYTENAMFVRAVLSTVPRAAFAVL